MLFDLQGDAHMSTVVGMLYAAVVRNSERLQQITEGMAQEEVDYRGPDGRFNSTAQLIKHITYVDLNWVYRIKDQPLPLYMQEQFGPMIDENDRLPMITGVSLSTLMANRNLVLKLLVEACISLRDADLDSVVAFGHENEKRATLRWGLWHMADHCRYHQAHINQLRKWYRENHERLNDQGESYERKI